MPLPAMCLECNSAAAKGDVLCDICRELHNDRIEALRAEERAARALDALRKAIDLGGAFEAEETA